MSTAIRTIGPSEAQLPGEPYKVQVRHIHGYERAFVHQGTGPALLLIHGIGSSLDTWRYLIPALSERYTVIAPDLLGHGRSSKPRADYSVPAYANAMRDLLSVLGVDRVTVIGHSLGGGVATQFAYQYPEHCERLVLISSGGVARDVHPFLRCVSAPGADVALHALNFRGVPWALRAGFQYLAMRDADIALDRDVLTDMFTALADNTSREAFVRTLRAVVDRHGQVITMLDRCYLAQDIPTLLLWGSRDAVIPMEHGFIARDAMPGSRLHVFEGAGHFPHYHQAAQSLEVLEQFIRDTRPAVHDEGRWRALLTSTHPALTGATVHELPQHGTARTGESRV